MSDEFFKQPILNSPYEYPARHWELDDSGLPTQRIVESRRSADFITPIPRPRTKRGTQASLDIHEAVGDSDERYHRAIINGLRLEVDKWRQLPESGWRVTPETARLLKHWRYHKFASIRPFFCQVEAAETIIWLTEVARQLGNVGKEFLEHMGEASEAAIWRPTCRFAQKDQPRQPENPLSTTQPFVQPPSTYGMI